MKELGSAKALPSIHWIETIFENQDYVFYRGRDLKKNQNVLIKLYRSEVLTPMALSQFKHEYDLLQKIESSSIAKVVRFEESSEGLALILEDFAGVPLQAFLKQKGNLSLEEFFYLGEKMIEALSLLHENNIIHRDLKSANFMVDKSRNLIKMVDFGLSVMASQAGVAGTSAQALAYISPEQTGRMNRAMDHRSDFYSLGVIFYEMLLGEVPFQSDDPLELIHAHIAREVPAVSEGRADVPSAISRLVSKLVGKSADSRYQSCLGLLHDFRQISQLWKDQRDTSTYPLGEADVPLNLKITENFYGREVELTNLKTAFEKRTQGGDMEIIFVTGGSGIGKSSLIQELQRPLVKERGYFITGKFDQFKRDQPYYALMQAFTGLIQQILAESEQRIALWKAEILNEVGDLGGALIPLIPNLEKLVGLLPVPMALSPDETEKRFYNTVLKFMKAVAKKNHPLVVFLDDMQWADFSTLKLLQRLLTADSIKYFLLITSYRDNEVNSTHPLYEFRRQIGSLQVKITELPIRPLLEENIVSMVADTFRKPPQDCQELAKVVFGKARGNPFFTQQLLKVMYERKIVRFQAGSGWIWNIQDAKNLPVSENVTEFLTEKIKEFPEETRELLSLGACIGASFEIDLLARMKQVNNTWVFEKLYPALKEDLILSIGDEFKFQHDRIQEASYLLISESRRIQQHFEIGKAMLAATENQPQRRNEKIFEIVNHLNQASEFQTASSDRHGLAKLNSQAAEKAAAAFIYQRAIEYYNAALNLYGSEGWNENYESVLAIQKQLSRAHLALGAFEKAGEILELALKKCTNLLDRAEVQIERIIMYKYMNQSTAAIRISLEALKEFGIIIPENPSTFYILKNVLKARLNIKKKTVDQIVNDDEIRDRKEAIIFTIYNEFAVPCFIIGSRLTPVVMSQGILKKKSYYSSNAYAGYMAMNMAMFRDYEFCQKLTQVSERLLERFPNPHMQTKVHYLSMSFAKYFFKSARTLREDILRTFSFCEDTGDRFYGEFAAVKWLDFLMFFSFEISDTVDFLSRFDAYMETAGSKPLKAIFEVEKNIFRMLTGQPVQPLLHEGQPFDEKAFIAENLKTNNFSCLIIHLNISCIYHFLMGDYKKANEYIAIANKFSERGVKGNTAEVTLRLFRALLAGALFDKSDSSERKSLKKTLKKEIKWFSKLIPFAKENFYSVYLLLQAEDARLEDRIQSAEDLYDQSIQVARENRWPFFMALANEAAGRFYLNRKKAAIASVYINEAKKLFRRWGSHPKVQQLETAYVFDNSMEQNALSYSQNKMSQDLDYLSVLKATRIISKEVRISEVLAKSINILMENAGAQRGALILNERFSQKKHSQNLGAADPMSLKVAARGEYQNRVLNTVIREDEYLTAAVDLPLDFLNFVFRSSESVIIDDAQNQHRFEKEKYFQKDQTKSVLALPIINQGQTLGILYLQNNLLVGAFTEQRVELLTLLVSQIAVSIENSLLYSNMETQIRDRTKDIRTIMENLRYGIFTFGSDFKVRGEYSAFLKTLFQKERFDGIAMQNLVFDGTEWTSDQVSQAVNSLSLSFYEPRFQFDLNSSRLPKELTKHQGQQILELDWVPLEDDEDLVHKVMLTIRDVTELRKAEKLLEQHEREKKLFTEILEIGPERFEQFILSTQQTLQRVVALIESINFAKEAMLSAQEILRSIHTIKGNARIYHLSELVTKVHDFESLYTPYLKDPQAETFNKDHQLRDLRQILDQTTEYQQIYESKFGRHRTAYDSDWLKVEALLKSNSMAEALKTVSLKNEVPFRGVFDSIARQLPDLAKTLNKPTPEIIFKGSQVGIHRAVVAKLEGLFNHLISNSMDHGFSSEQKAQITIETRVNNSSLTWIYHDNGRGLALSKLRQKGRANGLISEKAGDLEVANLIFKDANSTAEKISEISGRGVGMSAVKAEVEGLDGNISLRLHRNSGSQDFCPFQVEIEFRSLPDWCFSSLAEVTPVNRSA